MARTSEDLRTVTTALLGTAPAAIGESRVLWLGGYAGASIDPDVREACEREAVSRGWETSRDADRVFSEICAGVEKTYPVLGGAEAAAVHRVLMERHAGEYDPVVLARLKAGSSRTDAELATAWAHLERIRAAFSELYEHFDALAWPCVPCVAQPKSRHDDALRAELLRLNTPVSLAGLPAVSMPVPVGDSGLTAGIQVVSAGLDRLVL